MSAYQTLYHILSGIKDLLFYMCVDLTYLFPDSSSGDEDRNVNHDQNLPTEVLDVRKFSAKIQHSGQLKQVVIPRLHN